MTPQERDHPANETMVEYEALHAQDVASSTAPVAKPAKLPFKKRLVVGLTGLIGTTVIRLLALSYRYRVHFGGVETSGRSLLPKLEALRGPGKEPLLFALWHGSCFPILSYWRGRALCVITSRSTDGQVLARMLRGLGFTTVNGSSSRGGTRALIDLTHVVRNGTDAAIAVDGPRGPIEQVKPGIILLAKLTGRPIIPLASSAKRFWRFQSWDRFRLPFPFTKAVVIAGDPMYVPADADHELMEKMRLELEQRIRTLQMSIDEQVQPKIWKRADSERTKRRKQLPDVVATK